MLFVLLRFTPFILILITWFCLELSSPYCYLPILINFVIHPFVDFITKNKLSKTQIELSAKFNESILWGFTLLFFLFIVRSFFLLESIHSNLEMLNLIGCVGIICGSFGLIISHEFIHDKSKKMRAIGVLVLSLFNYSWFLIEHIKVHHRHLGTENDPSSAIKGQSIYKFILPSLFLGFKKSFVLEYKRTKKNIFENIFLYFFLVHFVYASFVFYHFGHIGILYFYSYSLVALIFISTVNYIQHYGLKRLKQENGKFERVGEKHSWDSEYSISSFSTFNFNVHSDHHINSTKIYSDLKYSSASPKMPFGYSLAIILAFFPVIWMKIMDEKLANS